MIVRPATYRDFEAIKEIFSIAFDQEYSQRGVDIVHRISKYQKLYPVVKVLSLFENPYQHLFRVHICEVDGQVAGLCQISTRNKNASRWHIDNIAVHPQFRGRGVAKYLLNEVFTFYNQRGALRFTLEVDVKNTPAISLYEKIGFKTFTTLYYYKMTAEELINFRGDGPLEMPSGLKSRTAGDIDQIVDLYKASIPSFIRTIEDKNVTDFSPGIFRIGTELLKRQMGKAEYFRWIYYEQENNRCVASIEVSAQHRALPHVIQLLVHPAYSKYTEPLLRYTLNFLAHFQLNSILIGSFKEQGDKIEAVQELGFKEITADYQMVKDSLQVVTLPAGLSDTATSEDGSLKPIIYSHPE